MFSVEQAINIALSKGVIWSSVVPPERVKESPWFEVIGPQHKAILSLSIMTDTSPVLLRDISSWAGRTSTLCAKGQHVSFPAVAGQVVFLFKDGEEPRLLWKMRQ